MFLSSSSSAEGRSDSLLMSLAPIAVLQMSKSVLNVKYLLLLSFLTAIKLYILGHIQGIVRVHYLKRDLF